MKRQEITESNVAYKSVELGTVAGLFIGFTEVWFSALFPFSFLRGNFFVDFFLFSFKRNMEIAEVGGEVDS